MGIESLNEPGPPGRTWMVQPASINEPPKPPVVTDMSPDTVAIGDPSFDLVFTGTGFDPIQCFIAFAGQREPARFIDDTHVYTIVNMATWFGPDVVKAAVYNGNAPSQWFDFTFTATTHEADPDELEAEIEEAEEEGDFKPTHPRRKKTRR